jgi:entericidin B
MRFILSIMVLSFTLSACNTVNGIGKDLEKAGEAVQKTTK